MKNINSFERGSEWRQWDLHIHTPASFHWNGPKFDPNPNSDANRKIIDEMIAALNAAEPTVFALMDYWTFEGWFALKRRLKEKGAPELHKTVFPGIELRLMAPMPARLNAHVLFSNEVSDQVLQDFKAALTIEIVKRPLSNDSLIELACNHLSDDALKNLGYTKEVVKADPAAALLAGSMSAEINCDSYKTAIEKVPNDHAIGFMPWDTNDGLAKLKWQTHYAYFIGLFNSSPIFESRDIDLRGAFVGEETEGNSKYFKNFQDELGYVPRLVVSGSDAHRFVGTAGDNNKRGYGDFPSGKATWIKADPTFRGLLQAIMEPAKRSFIGEKPPKLVQIASNNTFFIDSVDISKVTGATTQGTWLDGTKLPINPDLVAIIGNRGSGKSALADVIALLGNSKQKNHFSFLKRDRFRGKSGDPARNFEGILTWLDKSEVKRNLNDDPPEDKVELVRYIPQGHFEELCNAHVSGKSDAFENELREVIFSHANDSIRLGALDFDQLIEQQESSFRSQLNEYRKDLHGLNQEISSFEDQLQPEIKSSLLELLQQKNRQIDEHNKLKPAPIEKPKTELSPEQKQVSNDMEQIAAQLKQLDEAASGNATKELSLAGKIKAIQNIQERLRLLERSHQQFMDETSKDFEVIGIKATEIASLTVDRKPLLAFAKEIPEQQSKLQLSNEELISKKNELLKQQSVLQEKLNAPQLLYQQNLMAIEGWEAKLAELTGTAEAPETQKGLLARIAQIDKLPSQLESYQARRLLLTGDIYDILNSQRKAREELFKPVQDLIQSNSLIRDEYKLQFQATLGGSADSVGTSLFELIKQNSGEFRGEDESYAAIRQIADQHDFNNREQVLSFVSLLHNKIALAAGGKDTVGISSILRKDKEASEVYNLLFGLSFLEPRYSLLYQDTQIEQLSPGQRGALLLIFYLLVDKGRNPIILDQPEENLDNETVVSLLVPVLTEAKKRRQIIMVTHNPNLAVVCDAEQVIWSTFNRKGSSKITYLAGSIENPTLNLHVVNVLEGTMPAFNNRSSKYH